MLARLGFMMVTPVLVAGALLLPRLVTATHSMPGISEAEPASAEDLLAAPRVDSSSETNEDEATDVYGNDVAAAVATYRFDAGGALYELHSPQTQLPRLGSPKS
jgi:hypothetical protein